MNQTGQKTLTDLHNMKSKGKKIAMVTAYDYSMARLVDEAGADMILVGDSLGMVMLGYPDTLQVTVDDMVHHSAAVARGTRQAFVVADMPFLACRTGKRDALLNAGRLMAEGRAQAVKMEGGAELCELVTDMVQAGIPVMGHLGLTPQSVNALGGYHVQGKSYEQAKKLVQDAIALDEAGVFGLVLECVPAPLAKLVTQSVSCITIGIGGGVDCDGQVLVLQDLLGMYSDMQPKFVRRFAEAGDCIKAGIRDYCQAVRAGTFPDAAHSFAMDEETVQRVKKNLR